MSERDNMLERVREALRAPSRTSAHGLPNGGSAALPKTTMGNGIAAAPARKWLPLVPGDPAAQLDSFAKNATDLKASFHRVLGLKSATDLLRQVWDQEGWKRAATHPGALTDAIAPNLGLLVLGIRERYEAAELEQCDVGITQCDALVAQTGSVLLTSHSAGGRALSALPPHHVVLATRDQLVPDLPEAFAVLRRRYQSNYPSFISFVTGPSRTGDIERILVLGAHGPKKLTILVIDPA